MSAYSDIAEKNPDDRTRLEDAVFVYGMGNGSYFGELAADELSAMTARLQAAEELAEAASKVMLTHDADAVRCNFVECGCSYCDAIRSALAKFKGTASPEEQK